MPSTHTPLEPGQPRPETAESPPGTEPVAVPTDPDAPLSFVPHPEPGVPQQPVLFRSNRFGALEEHEIVRLLDSIEDERARGRFRESIYVSVFIWIAIAWIIFYGPRYLWHAPKLISPTDIMRQRELTQLTSPILPRMAAPRPTPKPTIDNHTLEHLRSMAPKPSPRPSPTPLPEAPNPVTATPPAPSTPPPPTPQPQPRNPPPVIAEAPTPQRPTKPDFSTGGTAGDNIQSAIRNTHPGGGGGVGISGGPSSPLGTGVDILSDTQGVNFQPYLARLMRQIYNQWIVLIPEEARPPLSKSGMTQLRITIMPDGSVHANDGVHDGLILETSTHDNALNRAAWGSITGNQFSPLPPQFHGPDLELRIRYLVNKQPE